MSMNVFANPHFEEAIKHASAAAQAGDSSKIFEHTMASALAAKGLTKALDLSKAKKSTEGTASA